MELIDGRFHLIGYSDAAHVVKLRSEGARRLCDLSIHESVLRDCSDSLSELKQIPAELEAIRKAAIAGIATKFFSCFGRNESMAVRLEGPEIFGGIPEALACFKYWKSIRDLNIAHNISEYTQAYTGLVLDHAGEMQDVVSISFKPSFDDPHHMKPLESLVAYALEYVMAKAQLARESLIEEVKQIPPEERLSLEHISFTAPTAASASVKRPI